MRKRNVLIQFRLSDKEADKFNRLVAKTKLTRSTYLRFLINGLVPRDTPPPDYYAMMRKIYAIGNNLNQIAHHAHFTGVVDEERYHQNVRKLDEAIRHIREAVVSPEPRK